MMSLGHSDSFSQVYCISHLEVLEQIWFLFERVRLGSEERQESTVKVVEVQVVLVSEKVR